MDMMQPNRLLTVTLSPQEWTTVMAGLNGLPHGVARPVFDRVGQQLQQQSSQALAARGNGADADPAEAS